MQATVDTIAPYLQSAGQKASQAKTSLAENFVPALSSFMGKGKDMLGAAGAQV